MLSARKLILLAGASGAALCVAHVASAQAIDGSIPSATDENGVDLIGQQYYYSNSANAFIIGDLEYRHSVGLNVRSVNPDNYTKRIGVITAGANSSGYAQIDFGVGGLWPGHSSKYFSQPDWKVKKFYSSDGDGSYVQYEGSSKDNYAYVYYAADGSKEYYKVGNYSDGSFYVDKFEKPDGSIVSIDYKLNSVGTKVGPRTITSNHGFMLQFEYQSDTQGSSGYAIISAVNGYNLAEDVCAAGAAHCALKAGRPRVVFAYETDKLTETNSAGEVSEFSKTVDGNSSTLHIKFPNGIAANKDNITAKSASTAISELKVGDKTWNYNWNYNGGQPFVIGVTDGNGNVKKYSVFKDANFSHRNRLTSSVNGDGGATSYEYNAKWQVSRITLPNGNKIDFTRNDAYQTIAERRLKTAQDGAASDTVESFAYSTSCSGNLLLCRQPISFTDAAHQTTNYTYNSAGQIETVVQPANNEGARATTKYNYTPYRAFYKKAGSNTVMADSQVSMLTSVSTCLVAVICTDPAKEFVQTIDYGPQTGNVGNNLFPVSETLRSGNGAIRSTRSFSYDARGNVVSIDGPLESVDDRTFLNYDARGRVVGVVGPKPVVDGERLPSATRTGYDYLGNIVLQEAGTLSASSNDAWATFNALRKDTLVRDDVGVLVRTISSGINPSGVFEDAGIVDFVYDAGGRLTCDIVRMNSSNWGTRKSSCEESQLHVANPDRVTKYSYDSADRITLIQEGYGSDWQENALTTEYNISGQKTQVSDGKFNRTSYEYDPIGRLQKIKYPSGTAGVSSISDYEAFSYNSAGRMDQHLLRDGVTQKLEYDSQGRITSIKGGNAPDLTYSYDLAGRQISASLPTASLQVAKEYDAFGRIVREVSGLGTVSYEYDSASRRTRISWPGSYYVDYEYDSVGNVIRVKENGATEGLGVLAQYRYDALGELYDVTFGNGTRRIYARDSFGRPKGLSIDLAGTANDLTVGALSVPSKQIAYNGASQITSLLRDNDAYAWRGSYNTARTYDVNALNQYLKSGSTGLSYDARGNLIQSATINYSYNTINQLVTVSGARAASLNYDALGRLSQIDSSNAVSRFLYSGSDLIAEYNGEGALLRRFVPGASPNQPLVWTETNGGRRWLQGDERGSIVSVADDSGASIAINSYDEFGVPSAENLGRFQYTGQVYLPEIGLYYYKARFYSPTLGRFLQTDPLGYADGLNWYQYAQNDPVNGSDPSGLATCTGDWSKCPIISAPGSMSGSGAGVSSTWGNYYGGDLFYGSQPIMASLPRRGTPGTMDSRAASPQNQCRSAPISSTEAAAARAGNRKAFWTSRLASGDPIAGTALSIVNDTGLGRMTNGRLLGAIYNRSPNQTDAQAWAEIQTIGVEIMVAHVAAVGASGGNLSAAATAQYHFDVFAKHQLDPSTFGGAAFTGSQGEASMTSPIWRNGCR